RGEAVGRLSDVTAVSAGFVEHGRLHRRTVDAHLRLVHARAGVGGGEGEVGGAGDGGCGCEFASYVGDVRAGGLFEGQVGGVEVDGGGVVVGVALAGGAFERFRFCGPAASGAQ